MKPIQITKPQASRSGEKGMSIITQLLAIGAVMGAFTLVGYILKYTTETYTGIKSELQMLTLETRFLSYLNSSEAFSDYREEMKEMNGVMPARSITWDGATIANIGGSLFYTADGEACNNASGNCAIRFDSSVLCQPQAVGSNCLAAYRIVALKEKLVNLGVRHANAFQPADHIMPISFEVTKRLDDDSCSQTDNYVAAGLNKENGQVQCVRRSQTQCAAGQIARGLRYDATRGTLEPVCESTQTISCPPNYVLNTVQVSSLESGRAKSGTCVFQTKRVVPWAVAPPAAPSVSGTYCPQYYRTAATCTVRVTAQWNGSCPQTCNCDPDGRNCQTCFVPSSPSNVGAYTLQHGVNQTASCEINVGTQSCGAGWTGVVQMNGTCVLTEPETRPAI